MLTAAQPTLTAPALTSYTERTVGRPKVKQKMVSVRLSEEAISLMERIAALRGTPDKPMEKTKVMEEAIRHYASHLGFGMKNTPTVAVAEQRGEYRTTEE